MSIPENPWFLQAEDDLKMAKLAFANGFYSQTCYHASQSAEMAIKQIIIDLGELPPKTHALNRLKGMLSQLGLPTSELEDLKRKPCVQFLNKKLDQRFFISYFKF